MLCHLFFVCFSFFCSFSRCSPGSTLFPYTTLFRSPRAAPLGNTSYRNGWALWRGNCRTCGSHFTRSEEHTSELQSRGHLVCRLLLEKKKKTKHDYTEIYV